MHLWLNYAVRVVSVSVASGFALVAVIAAGAGGVSWAMDPSGEVATFGDLPLVVGLDERAGGQAYQ